jgi:hypothetical protein
MGDKATADEQRTFENNCLRLRQNDPTLTFVNDGTASSNGETCATNHVLLGQSLMGNCYLRTLSFHQRILGKRVARVLAAGIAQMLQFLSKRNQQQAKILRILYEGIRLLPSLKVLWFVHVTSQELVVLCEFISSLTTLEQVFFGGRRDVNTNLGCHRF